EYPLFVKEPPSHISAEMEKVVDIPCQARGDCFHLPFFQNIFFFPILFLCFSLSGSGSKGENNNPLLCPGTPQPDIVWYKDAAPISPVKIPRYRVLVGGSLQINGLLPDDTGMFQCFAPN
ncbi:unnamed protein product, partial [Tetraodon nigroviridis]